MSTSHYREVVAITIVNAGLIVLSMAMGCGRDAGEAGRQGSESPGDTATHYPRETTYDTAREAIPAMPVPMDTVIKSVPEAGKRLDAGDTGIITPR